MKNAQRPAPQSRRRLHTAMAIVMTAGLTISVGAWADWAVNDHDANQTLEKIQQAIGKEDGTVVNYQKNQSTVGQGDFTNDTGDGQKQGKYIDPEVSFKSSDLALTKNAAKLTSITMDDDVRCPAPTKPKSDTPDGGAVAPSSGDGIAEQQTKICRDILETQKAQFKYNVVMSELANTRYQRLREIEDQRGKIGDTEAGKLQDNTNKMLALIALIQIDQQQQKAYNDAYNARIIYLQGVQERLSQMAIHGNGKPGLKEIAGSLGEYAALAGKLGVSPGDLISK